MTTRETKLFIHHQHGDVESGPAEVVGNQGKDRLFRLLFIPFMYATPTYGDVVAARRDPEFHGNYAFDCPNAGGMDTDDLHQHGGRYTMVVDFELADSEGEQWFEEEAQILSALAWPADATQRGRVYFAVQEFRKPSDVLELLRSRHPNSTFHLVHPADDSAT